MKHFRGGRTQQLHQGPNFPPKQAAPWWYLGTLNQSVSVFRVPGRLEARGDSFVKRPFLKERVQKNGYKLKVTAFESEVWGGCMLEQSFPTCQVRVVRFYVSLFSSSSRTPPPPPPSSSSSCRDPVSSVWRAGLQPRAREFSVACRTPTAIL